MGAWEDMLNDAELRRRRALARLTKPQLIDRLIETENDLAQVTSITTYDGTVIR